MPLQVPNHFGTVRAVWTLEDDRVGAVLDIDVHFHVVGHHGPVLAVAAEEVLETGRVLHRAPVPVSCDVLYLLHQACDQKAGLVYR